MRPVAAEEVAFAGKIFALPGHPVWQLRMISHFPLARRTHILLTVPWERPDDAEALCREGWPTTLQITKTPIPHFAVDADGIIVQSLDPAQEGSGCMDGIPDLPAECRPGTVLTIALIGLPSRATVAARAAADALVAALQRCYGPNLPVLVADPWNPAVVETPKPRPKRSKPHGARK